MATVTCLLVLACAVAISAQPLYCTTASVGYLQGTPVELKTVTLQGYADWKVTIQDVPQCVQGIGGISAIICDSDSVPEAKFQDLRTLSVHRTGQLQGYATVKGTAYCVQAIGPLLDNQYGLTNQDHSQVRNLVLKPY